MGCFHGPVRIVGDDDVSLPRALLSPKHCATLPDRHLTEMQRFKGRCFAPIIAAGVRLYQVLTLMAAERVTVATPIEVPKTPLTSARA